MTVQAFSPEERIRLLQNLYDELFAQTEQLRGERQQTQEERDSAEAQLADETLTNAQLREDAKNCARATGDMAGRLVEAQQQRQQAIDALREARPYVYGVARDKANQGWRAQTAESILARVDAALGEQKP